nr:MAG TPA: hypothetical protein [Caudoviricetes sp.]
MSDIDKLFEKMSREAANAMNGTHPPVPKKKVSAKSTSKKTAVKKTTKTKKSK